MKYETPELTALTDAILVIQTAGSKSSPNTEDTSGLVHAGISCYEDNE